MVRPKRAPEGWKLIRIERRLYQRLCKLANLDQISVSLAGHHCMNLGLAIIYGMRVRFRGMKPVAASEFPEPHRVGPLPDANFAQTGDRHAQ